jgi:hypothetical protein
MFLVRIYWSIASHRVAETEQEKIWWKQSASSVHDTYLAWKLEKTVDLLNGGGKHIRQMPEAATKDVVGRFGQSLWKPLPIPSLQSCYSYCTRHIAANSATLRQIRENKSLCTTLYSGDLIASIKCCACTVVFYCYVSLLIQRRWYTVEKAPAIWSGNGQPTFGTGQTGNSSSTSTVSGLSSQFARNTRHPIVYGRSLVPPVPTARANLSVSRAKLS